VFGTIVFGTIVFGTIVFGTIVFGTIAYGTIMYGTIVYGTIVYGTIVYGTIVYGTIVYGTTQERRCLSCHHQVAGGLVLHHLLTEGDDDRLPLPTHRDHDSVPGQEENDEQSQRLLASLLTPRREDVSPHSGSQSPQARP
jgi:hypothetical protein